MGVKDRPCSKKQRRDMDKAEPLYQDNNSPCDCSRQNIDNPVTDIPGTTNRECANHKTIDRKISKEALYSETIFMEQMFQSSPDAIAICDANGKVVRVNRRFLEMFGHANHEIPGRSIDDLIVPEAMQKRARAETALLVGGIAGSYEALRKTRDGSVIEVAATGTPVLINGKPGGFYTIYRDITERKRTHRITMALYQISKAVNSTRSLDEFFKLIHEALSTIIDTKNFYIALYEEENGIITFPYFADEKKEKFDFVFIDDPLSTTAEVIRTGKPYFARTKELEKRYGSAPNNFYGVVAKVWLGVPLAIKGKVIGAVAVQGYYNPLQYSEKDITLLESISEQIALAIDSKRIEEALSRSEEKYRSILESIVEGYYEVDLVGNCTFLNDALCKMIGYQREEVIGKNNRMFMHPDTARMVYELFNKVYISGRPVNRGYFNFIHKKGTARFVEGSVALILDDDGNPVGFRGMVNDVTELRRSEQALRESESRYRTLFDSAADAVFVHRMGRKFLDVNIIACERYGYTKNEFMEMTPADIVPGDQALTIMDQVEKVLEHRHVISESVHVRKDGIQIPTELSSRVIEFGGEPAILTTARDITERLRAEQEKKRMEARLSHARKMEAIGTLAGGVAHDLNNILAGLVSYPELLLMDIPEESPLRPAILNIQKSGEKAAAIVQDLLTLARRGVAVTEVVDLNQIITQHMESPEHRKLLAYHPNVNITMNLDPDLFMIMGSPVHLSKTVMNLMSNAAEAMPEKGFIRITTKNLYIDEPVRGYDKVARGDYVVLTVEDEGIGINDEDMDRIFEPFYTKKAMGRSGTGLGMAVVWGTVKDHKGYIDVDSTEGEGTLFTLYFPVTREKMQLVEEMSIAELKGNGERIVVVDDVAEQRSIATEILRKLNYNVVSFSSGEDALVYLKTEAADLILLDMIMTPGLDGMETYRELIKFRPGQKAVIVSGFSETERIKEAQRLGAGPYVKKPYLMASIGRAVRDELLNR